MNASNNLPINKRGFWWVDKLNFDSSLAAEQVDIKIMIFIINLFTRIGMATNIKHG